MTDQLPLPGMPTVPTPTKTRSRSARLGYDGEHAVEQYLTARGFPCKRPRAGGPHDVGDLDGLPVVVSVKNWATSALAEWVDALPQMVANAGLNLGVVWHKRRGRGSPGDWYVTMDGDTFLVLLESYRRPRAALGSFSADSGKGG